MEANNILPEKYQRKENETDFEWKERLIVYKLEDKEDVDWIEIVNVLGLSCSGEHLRKTGYGIYESYKNKKQKLISENITDTEVLDEIELRKIELEKSRKKLQTTKIEYNKILRESAREEMLFEYLKESIEKSILEVPDFNPIELNQTSEKEGVLSFADSHFGKIFESINNKYDKNIFKHRFEKLLVETVQICKEQGLTHLHIINGADSIEGMCLRISQLSNLEMGITDMTIEFSRFMAQFLNDLSKDICITYHQVPNSNHSEVRPLGTRAGQFPLETMEKIIITYIHDVLQNNKRIEVPIYDKDFVRFKIFDYIVYAKHGHQIKNVKTAIRDMTMLHREFIDYMYLAHYHHNMNLTVNAGSNNNCEVIIIPSIMGSDEYSDSLMTSAKASALLDVYIKNQGRRLQYNILLN